MQQTVCQQIGQASVLGKVIIASKLSTLSLEEGEKDFFHLSWLTPAVDLRTQNNFCE